MTELPQYQTLRQSAGWLAMPPRTLIEVTGRDRMSFLQNMLTNDVTRLVPGQGCEGFTLTAQGKIVGHFFVWIEPDRLLLDSSPGQAQTLVDHFERYLIREDVQLLDLSSHQAHCLVTGPGSAAAIGPLMAKEPPAGLLDHFATSFGESKATVVRVDWCGPDGFVLICGAQERDAVGNSLIDAGIPRCDDSWLEVLRIENKTPWFGIDIFADNLPQEVDRIEQTISFRKGCYLGQETVARIDAMGHVNRRLVGLRLDGSDVPAAQTELTHEGKIVGKITSAAYSPGLQCPIALAYLRRPLWDIDCSVDAPPSGTATVIELPVSATD